MKLKPQRVAVAKLIPSSRMSRRDELSANLLIIVLRHLTERISLSRVREWNWSLARRVDTDVEIQEESNGSDPGPVILDEERKPATEQEDGHQREGNEKQVSSAETIDLSQR